MSEELGKVEKPSVAEFKKGRKLFFVPLLFSGSEPPADYLEKFTKYWNQVENQLGELESKLGRICKIYHELVVVGGDDGIKLIKSLNEKSYLILENRLNKGAKLEVAEDDDLLTCIMDCQRCLSIGLQNQKIFSMLYESYTEATQKRNEYIAKRIDETLGPDEIGILLMAEKHQVRFPSDVQVFYVAPPALDEINRWLRDRESAPRKEEKPQEPEAKPPDKPEDN